MYDGAEKMTLKLKNVHVQLSYPGNVRCCMLDAKKQPIISVIERRLKSVPAEGHERKNEQDQ